MLRGAAKPVEKIDDSIRRLVERMTDIMIEHRGIGLAAPQAGVPLRLFIVSMDVLAGERAGLYQPDGDAERRAGGAGGRLPVRAGHVDEGPAVQEGDRHGHRPRRPPFTEEAEGMYARCLQHEYDHIEGMTIVNRMGSAAKIAHRRQLKKLAEEQEGK